MDEPSVQHFKWPGSYPMEKTKRKFDKIDGLPNCCCVVHTTQITFGSQDRDGEENDSVLMRAIVDPDMRFTQVWLASDLLELDSVLLEYYEAGDVVNGSKLKLSDGSEDGEYIIGVGDAGYPLRPWTLTPDLLEDGLSLSDAKVEFNRRHSVVTAVALRALAMLKHTWKCLQGEAWHPDNDMLRALSQHLIKSVEQKIKARKKKHSNGRQHLEERRKCMLAR